MTLFWPCAYTCLGQAVAYINGGVVTSGNAIVTSSEWCRHAVWQRRRRVRAGVVWWGVVWWGVVWCSVWCVWVVRCVEESDVVRRCDLMCVWVVWCVEVCDVCEWCCVLWCVMCWGIVFRCMRVVWCVEVCGVVCKWWTVCVCGVVCDELRL